MYQLLAQTSDQVRVPHRHDDRAVVEPLSRTWPIGTSRMTAWLANK